MTNIVGVRFRMTGKIYYFDPKDLDIKRGSHVIVETARGMEYGTVILGPKNVPDEEVVAPLREVIRIATPDDDEREWENRFHEREAYQICKEKILAHNLDMKLIQAEYTFDNNKLLFYFTAEGRIDFRDLVKDLAGIFRTRIELRQIGVRDETKILGGIGICGRELCCHTFLSDFAPVSIKMAKEQNLSLNPTKISGTCGRLMCCLNNEAETYHYLNSKLPKNGEIVRTIDGFTGKVQSVSVLRQHVKVIIEKGDEREVKEYPVEELGFRGHEPVAVAREPKKEELFKFGADGFEYDEAYTEEIVTEDEGAQASEERRRTEKKDRPEKKNKKNEERPKQEKKDRPAKNGQKENRGGSKNKNRRQKEAPVGKTQKQYITDWEEAAQEEPHETSGRRRRRPRRSGGSGEGWDSATTMSADAGSRRPEKKKSEGAPESGSGKSRQEASSGRNPKNSGKNPNSGKNSGNGNRSQNEQNHSERKSGQNGATERQNAGAEGAEGSGSAQRRRRRRNRSHSQNKPREGGES